MSGEGHPERPPEDKKDLLQEHRRSFLTFERFLTLWSRQPEDDAIGAKALRAFVDACSADLSPPARMNSRLGLPFWIYGLRLLCAYSRQPSNLALDLEKTPELNFDREFIVRLAVLWLLVWPEDLDGFVSSTGWDAAVHLLLYPPRDEIFHGTVVEGVSVASVWYRLWVALNRTSQDKTAQQCIKQLCKRSAGGECKARGGRCSHRFIAKATSYAGPPDESPYSFARGVRIQADSCAELLFHVAVLAVLRGEPEDAIAAGGFLVVYVEPPELTKVFKEMSSGVVQIRDRFLSLRSQRLSTLEEAELTLSLGCGLGSAFYVAWRTCSEEMAKQLLTADVIDAILALCYCCGPRQPSSFVPAGDILYQFLPSDPAYRLRSAWSFPKCFNPLCPTHHPGQSERNAARIPPVPAGFLPLLMGALYRAASFISEHPELPKCAARLTDVGYNLLNSLQQTFPARFPSQLMADAPSSPGRKLYYLKPSGFLLAKAWFGGFGLEPALVPKALVHEQASLNRESPAEYLKGLPARCSNATCNVQTGTMRCARCQRARYCSKECQREDWPKHKAVCKALAKAAGLSTKKEKDAEGKTDG